MAQFIFPFKPEPARRPRFSTKDHRGKALGYVKTHNSKEYDDYLNKCKLELMALGRRPCAPEKVTSLVCEFIFEVPKSWTLKQKAAAYGTIVEGHGKGDYDNLTKPVSDTMEEMGWIVNDKQIGGGLQIKRYQHSPEETTKTIVTILARL